MNIFEWIKKRNYSTRIFIVLVLLWFIVLPAIIILFNIRVGFFSYINLLFMGLLILIIFWLVFNSIESVIRGVIQKKFKEYLLSKSVALLLVSTMVIVSLIRHNNNSIVRSNFLIKVSDIVFVPALLFTDIPNGFNNRIADLTDYIIYYIILCIYIFILAFVIYKVLSYFEKNIRYTIHKLKNNDNLNISSNKGNP